MRTPAFVSSVLVFLSLTLTAQSIHVRDLAPLRSWPSAHYWAPSDRESEQLRRRPEASLSLNAAVTTTPLELVGMTPCRIVDTRDAGLPTPFGRPAMAAGEVRSISLPASTRCSIPSTAQAYSVNFTVVPSGPLGYLTAWPTPNRPSPDVSILNSLAGQIVANAAVLPAGTNGSIDVYVTNNTDVIIDINGYYVAGGGGSTLTPPVFLSSAQAQPTLSVSNNTTSSTSTNPLFSPLAVFVTGGNTATLAAGGRGIFIAGGNGGLSTAASGQIGGQGGIGLQVQGGTGGNSGASVGGQGGTAIVATGGDGAGGAAGTGPGGRGITVTGGAGGPGSQGDVGLFAIGGPGGGGTGGTAAIFVPGDPNGAAANFTGEVFITGPLHKPAGSFLIDHPQDPAHKYLLHSFVESPDMKNIYDGIVVLDRKGEAWVNLPAWFDALNRDFRYQLTPIGRTSPGLFIAQEVTKNRFKIAGGKPGTKVSWTVTGIRQDAYANAHRIPVEEEKPAAEQNTYLHPELYGEPEGKNVIYARNPELLEQVNAARSRAAELAKQRNPSATTSAGIVTSTAAGGQ